MISTPLMFPCIAGRSNHDMSIPRFALATRVSSDHAHKHAEAGLVGTMNDGRA